MKWWCSLDFHIRVQKVVLR